MAVAVGYSHLRMVLLDMAAQGHLKAFLKSAESKRGTWVADLSPPMDARAVHDRIAAAMGECLVDLFASGNQQSILVQGLVPFVREHRFLVVGHRVVASTPSCRTLSVLDALPHRILHPATARLHVPPAAPAPTTAARPTPRRTGTSSPRWHGPRGTWRGPSAGKPRGSPRP